MNKFKNILKDYEALLITSPYNIRFITNFRGEGICLLKEGFICLIVDGRYTEVAKAECKNIEIIEYSGKNLYSILSDFVAKHKIQTLGFEDRYITVGELNRYKEALKGVEFKPLNDALERLRMIKTDEELDCMKKAEHICDLAFSKVLPIIKAGISENDIAAEIEYQLRKAGSLELAFNAIAVSGVKSSMPHGTSSEKKLENGDFLTMDFGCKINGYCSDMTRTVAVGKISAEQKKIYDTVYKAQLAGLCEISAGKIGKDVDAVSRKIIDDAGYKGMFAHSLGHGVGLRIHELPNLSPSCDIELCENMVVSCEPGIYIPDFCGVRIEDMVIVKKGGCENLALSPKELIICG